MQLRKINVGSFLDTEQTELLEVNIKKALTEENIPQKKHTEIVTIFKNYCHFILSHKGRLSKELLMQTANYLEIALGNAGCSSEIINNISDRLPDDLFDNLFADVQDEINKIADQIHVEENNELELLSQLIRDINKPGELFPNSSPVDVEEARLPLTTLLSVNMHSGPFAAKKSDFKTISERKNDHNNQPASLSMK